MYDYELPERLIGKSPKEKRDESRLFVFDTKTGEIVFDQFKNIDTYLPKNSLLILNETKVVPARVILRKKTGGKVESLFLMNEWRESGRPGKEQGGELVPVIVDRQIHIGDILTLGDSDNALEVVQQKENIFILKTLFDANKLVDLLLQYGETPIPKYIKGVELSEDQLRARYQTVFAGNSSSLSVAAPTASLHFTPEVFEKLSKKGIEAQKITLNVGLGTFRPVTEENIQTNKLHKESYSISEKVAQNIMEAKSILQNTSSGDGRKQVVAVGTTTVRALESAAAKLLRGEPVKDGETDIFIHPPFDFKIVDCLVTNFHIPNSSLMMLVEAFLQYKKSPKRLVDLYKVAIENEFEFYSFGDPMLIL